MSRVFVAQDRGLGRRVAIKVLTREVAAEIKTERFRLEIQLAAKLQHPHIVPLLQSGDIGGILYYTMPFVEGESLRERISRDGALPITDAIRILRQVASAISYAHKQGVVHRDIKPDNVMLQDEFALVMDFGVARALSASTTSGDQRLTSSGVALGTPAYMAPEQALADPEIDHRADIYAFGILAYEVLTGEPPFKGKTAQATLAAHVVQPPEPIENKRAGIPPSVAALVMKSIEKKPSDRPQTAGDMLPIFDAAVTASPGDQLSLTNVPAVSTVSVTPPSTAAPALGAAPRSRVKWAVLAVALIAVIVAVYAATKLPSGQQASPVSGFTSVAVLPLVNVGGDKADEYFSDGMTDELANALGKLPGLKVASRTSAYSFKGKNANVEEIGKQLNVQTVMEGTVRRAGKKLRVSAQLTSAKDGLSLWSETYEREASDVFSVQDDIARSIAEALKPRLGGQAKTFSSASRGTENLAAYDLFLRGQYFLNARGAENLRLAVAYFDSAAARDPSFARAHAGLATAYALLPEYTDAAPKNVSQLTYDAASRALAIDSTLAEAYTARGLANVHDWRYDEAGVAYKKALRFNPNYPTAHQWYGELLFHMGRVDESVTQIRTATELEPLAPINASALGYALVVQGNYDEAIDVLKKGIEAFPTLGLHHTMLGDAYMMSGRTREAIKELEIAVRLDPELSLRKGYLAYGYGIDGQKEKARALIAELDRPAQGRGRSGVALAAAYMGLPDYANALTALEQAVTHHDISLLTASSLVPDKIWDPIRFDPRFVEILRKMNLLQYQVALRGK